MTPDVWQQKEYIHIACYLGGVFLLLNMVSEMQSTSMLGRPVYLEEAVWLRGPLVLGGCAHLDSGILCVSLLVHHTPCCSPSTFHVDDGGICQNVLLPRETRLHTMLKNKVFTYLLFLSLKHKAYLKCYLTFAVWGVAILVSEPLWVVVWLTDWSS